MDGIKIYRAKHSITQSELADALHVRRSTVAIWETKSKRLVQKLRRAFSCQILYGRLRFLRICATILLTINHAAVRYGAAAAGAVALAASTAANSAHLTVLVVIEIAFFNFLV